MFVVFHVAGTVLQACLQLPCSRYGVASMLVLNTDNKDGIIDSPANFNSFGATLSGPEALS